MEVLLFLMDLIWLVEISFFICVKKGLVERVIYRGFLVIVLKLYVSVIIWKKRKLWFDLFLFLLFLIREDWLCVLFLIVKSVVLLIFWEFFRIV